jgi:Na+/glutamate symporter
VEKGKGAIKSAVVPVASATFGAVAGIAGGVVLGRKVMSRNKKVLGVRIPGTNKGMSGFAHDVSQAGQQLGKLANEVREARERAEKVGKALT